MQLYLIENMPIFCFHARQAERLYSKYKHGEKKIETIIYKGKVYKGLLV